VETITRQLALHDEGRARQARGDLTGAIASWTALREQLRWPRVDTLLAGAALQLGRHDDATRFAQAAQTAYAALLARWTALAPRALFPGIAQIDLDLLSIRNVLSAVQRPRAAPAPPTPPARATETSLDLEGLPQGAVVLVDGRRARLARGQVRLAAGEHRVLVSARGRRPWRVRLVIGPGERVLRRVLMPPERPAGWLVAGIGAAALGIGAEVAALLLAAKANDLYTNDPAFAQYRSSTIAGHIAAGTLAAASAVSIYLFFRAPSRHPRVGRRSALALEPNSRGAVLFGAFTF